MRRHPERADVDRNPVRDETRGLEGMTIRHVRTCGLQDVVGVATDVHGHPGPDVSSEPVVVLVGMRDHHAEQTVVLLAEPGNQRQQVLMVLIASIQGQADIQGDSLTGGFEFDARAADFLGATVDSDSHA